MAGYILKLRDDTPAVTFYVARYAGLTSQRGDGIIPPSAMYIAGLASEMRHLRVEVDREIDGRWIAEVTNLPGVMAYGTTRAEAIAKAEALALRVLADRLDDTHKPVKEVAVFTYA